MGTYLLREIDAALWRAVRARAAADGITMRAVILGLLRGYSDGSITLRFEQHAGQHIGRHGSRNG